MADVPFLQGKVLLTPTAAPENQEETIIGVLFGCFARKIDGDSWFTWWCNHLPGPSISPKRTPMVKQKTRLQAQSAEGASLWGRGVCHVVFVFFSRSVYHFLGTAKRPEKPSKCKTRDLRYLLGVCCLGFLACFVFSFLRDKGRNRRENQKQKEQKQTNRQTHDLPYLSGCVPFGVLVYQSF